MSGVSINSINALRKLIESGEYATKIDKVRTILKYSKEPLNYVQLSKIINCHTSTMSGILNRLMKNKEVIIINLIHKPTGNTIKHYKLKKGAK